MFIGEMGSWLIVGGITLYRRYISKKAVPEANGYQAVDTHEGDVVREDNESISSSTTLNPAIKAMTMKEDRIPLTGWKILLLSLPAICDICGTTLMNVGLLFVVASIYQMTRGALVLFVGFFSVIFLKRKLHLFQWFALVTVVVGVAIVGLAGAIYKDNKAAPSAVVIQHVLTAVKREARTPEAVRAIVGVFLIAGAQIFTATQFVLEEFILEKYALESLKMVGWEGLFGFLVTALAMIVLHLAIGRTEAGRYGYFDLVEGWRQVAEYPRIQISSILIMISIGYVELLSFSVRGQANDWGQWL